MDEMILLKRDRFLEAILERVKNYIINYTTVLFCDGNVIGSGIFVEHNSHFGILTAHHVIGEGIGLDLFRNSSAKKLGVAIAVKADQHPEAVKGIQHLEFEFQYIRLHEIGGPPNGKYNEYGPDLIFLEILDMDKLGTIKAYSSFWNISSESNLINDCYDDSSCIWAICGLPQDWIEKQNSSLGRVIGCQCMTGFCCIPRRFDRNGFDYFDVMANCGPQNDTPYTFQGMSGGGLWKIPLSSHSCKGNSQDLEVEVNNIILSGIIFYETELKQNRRFIRSHGAKSIYEIFPKVLKKSEHRS